MMKHLVASIALSLLALSSFADLRLPKIFGDSMVLQRGRTIPVWGWADPKEKITVSLRQQKKSVVAGADGSWRVDLAAEQAGGPYELVIRGQNTITLHDVLIGEVWLCSGQSNMEFAVRDAKNADAEIASAHFMQIRDINIPHAVSAKPEDDIKAGASWKPATPANVGSFTAVGYFFARDLYNKLHVPIGIIHSSWGGTDVESWTSLDAMKASDEFGRLITEHPVTNLDSIAAEKHAILERRLDSLQGKIPDEAEVANWKQPDFNDSIWHSMDIPGVWEKQTVLENLDGTVWLRREVNVSAADAGKPATLQLAMIDDADETFVNGVAIGETNAYNKPRSYAIPAGVLKAGRNVIAVKVDDTGGNGGIYGKAEDVQLTVDATKISLAGPWKYRVARMSRENGLPNPNSYPALLYNGMIHPLIPFAIKGALWYQGENNAGRAYQYRTAFPLMINDWRKNWHEGNFPFYFVQLASFNSANGNSNAGSTWAELREAQTRTLSLPATGMAVTTDIGESHDIHPKNKQDVGHRLAAAVLRQVYNQSVPAGGPVYQSWKASGKTATVTFSNATGGLRAGGDKALSGFEIAGSDQHFYPATARIQGLSVTLASDSVAHPAAVRYAWADDAGDANLFNKAGFPAVPFRTDDWPEKTRTEKYTLPR